MEIPTRICVRIQAGENGKGIQEGSGIIIKHESALYLFTARHCICNKEMKIDVVDVAGIRVEYQEAFNLEHIVLPVKKIVKECVNDDWALLELEAQDHNCPTLSGLSDFEVNMNVFFRGYQKTVWKTSRSFNCIVKERRSGNEFRITLGPGEKFKDDVYDAYGLSGSGVLSSRGNSTYLLGILKHVDGPRAPNDDISCCSVEVLKDIFPDIFVMYNNLSDDVSGAVELDKVEVSDIRNFSEKITGVCPAINPIRIGQYCAEIASGMAELTPYDERVISSMKFRIFHACQTELLDFVEVNPSETLTVDEVKALLERFIDRAQTIIETKSQTYRYPISDRDILRKIVLDLINQCYLSFDKKGLYEFNNFS